MPGSTLMIFDIFSFYVRLISSPNEISTFLLSDFVSFPFPAQDIKINFCEKDVRAQFAIFQRWRWKFLSLNAQKLLKKKNAKATLRLWIDISPDFPTCLSVSLAISKSIFRHKMGKKAKVWMWSEWEYVAKSQQKPADLPKWQFGAYKSMFNVATFNIPSKKP